MSRVTLVQAKDALCEIEEAVMAGCDPVSARMTLESFIEQYDRMEERIAYLERMRDGLVTRSDLWEGRAMDRDAEVRSMREQLGRLVADMEADSQNYTSFSNAWRAAATHYRHWLIETLRYAPTANPNAPAGDAGHTEQEGRS
jgi:hypothetical protein